MLTENRLQCRPPLPAISPDKRVAIHTRRGEHTSEIRIENEIEKSGRLRRAGALIDVGTVAAGERADRINGSPVFVRTEVRRRREIGDRTLRECRGGSKRREGPAGNHGLDDISTGSARPIRCDSRSGQGFVATVFGNGFT